MKIVVISDVHGRTFWKDIVKQQSDADLFIFLGDYLDSFDISPENQVYNFRKIIQFKKENMDKVVLLLGNHISLYL